MLVTRFRRRPDNASVSRASERPRSHITASRHMVQGDGPFSVSSQVQLSCIFSLSLSLHPGPRTLEIWLSTFLCLEMARSKHRVRGLTFCSLVVPFVMTPNDKQSSFIPASKQRGMTLMEESIHKRTLVLVLTWSTSMYLDQRPPRISSIPTHKTTIHLQRVALIGHRLSCPHCPCPPTIPLPPIRLSRPSRQKGHVIKQKKSPAVTHSTRLGAVDFAREDQQSVRCSGRVAEQYLSTSTFTSSTCALARP